MPLFFLFMTTTPFTLLDILGTAQVHCPSALLFHRDSVVLRPLRVSYAKPPVDLRHELRERLRDVLRRLCRGLEEEKLVLLREAPALLGCHTPLPREVALVPDEHAHGRPALGVGVELGEPPLHGLEGLPVRDGVHDERTSGTAVVVGDDSAELLLPGSVPNLDLDVLLVDREGRSSKVDGDGGLVVLLKLVPCKAGQEVRLSHIAVSNYNNYNK